MLFDGRGMVNPGDDRSAHGLLDGFAHLRLVEIVASAKLDSRIPDRCGVHDERMDAVGDRTKHCGRREASGPDQVGDNEKDVRTLLTGFVSDGRDDVVRVHLTFQSQR